MQVKAQELKNPDGLPPQELADLLNSLGVEVEMDAEELANDKQYPKVFYARHMEPGLAKYEDETIYVSGNAIKNMAPSFAGKPVYVHHVNTVNLDNLKYEAHGYVVDTFYNERNGS